MPVTISKAVGSGLRTLERLLGSKSRARLLTIFVTHPGQEFYAQRLTAMTGLAESSIGYELRRLERLGVLVARPGGRERYYRIDDRHPLFPEVKQMVYKTSGLGEILDDALTGTSGVEEAFIYGSVAKGEERPTSHLDLFVLGTPNREKLATALQDAERHLGREINLVTMTTDEWRARISAGEGFVEELLCSPKILLIGDEGSLRGA